MALPSNTVAYYASEREAAIRRGDMNLAASIESDLRRKGWRPPAAQKRGRGRPPKPRCEHGRVVGRCADCEELEIAEARGLDPAA